jgi:hypothetical protein
VAQSLADADIPLSNSAARAATIRDAVRWIAEHKAEVKALNAEINEFMVKTVKGDLGFKIADFNAIYRVSQLEVEDRDALLECVREGWAALGIGGVVDWVEAAQATPRRAPAASPNEAARTAGYHDGLGGVRDHFARYPQGEDGHADYVLGLADGEDERDRVMRLGEDGNGHANGAASDGSAAPRRGRGRPRKQQEPKDAEAEA